ncbi:MAG: alpha/beta hydrolase [Candidatus Omnitrophica bacterium]|nr:alpha/beta hydrolase [Candidatus Omnitrophota bacterium]MBU1127928.1 alpha/beta hydrolase [Candidatus Omnitrophota bacterium]MBU1657095.1 alpha/beta hydrolase [Candidatus Omnitrophota bacterium]MBU1851611.1 alpha/beta hydrolase [Candidatus Omnitrophota bacterium]
MARAVLLPGWATDYHIFDKLDIAYNYLVPNVIDIDDFFACLARNLEWADATLIGWSFGGILGAHFMAKHPDLIKKAVFIGVKNGYSAGEIGRMKKYVETDIKAYLDGFYRKCFRGNNSADIDWFNSDLKKRYLKNPDTGALIRQLDFLKDNPLPEERLIGYVGRIKFAHGANDAIVNIQEAASVKENLPGVVFNRLEGVGHPAFLHPDFGFMV